MYSAPGVYCLYTIWMLLQRYDCISGCVPFILWKAVQTPSEMYPLLRNRSRPGLQMLHCAVI